MGKRKTYTHQKPFSKFEYLNDYPSDAVIGKECNFLLLIKYVFSTLSQKFDLLSFFFFLFRNFPFFLRCKYVHKKTDFDHSSRLFGLFN